MKRACVTTVKILAVTVFFASFLWPFVPFHAVFGWEEMAFKSRLLTRLVAPLFAIATGLFAVYLYMAAHWASTNSESRSGQEAE